MQRRPLPMRHSCKLVEEMQKRGVGEPAGKAGHLLEEGAAGLRPEGPPGFPGKAEKGKLQAAGRAAVQEGQPCSECRGQEGRAQPGHCKFNAGQCAVQWGLWVERSR